MALADPVRARHVLHHGAPVGLAALQGLAEVDAAVPAEGGGTEGPVGEGVLRHLPAVAVHPEHLLGVDVEAPEGALKVEGEPHHQVPVALGPEHALRLEVWRRTAGCGRDPRGRRWGR